MSEPTTLANGVLPGAGYVHLNEPVPTPCRITLSPDTSYAETVPAYLCTDDQPPMVMLGYGDPTADRVVLANAHAAGSPVRVDPPLRLPPFSGKDGACPKCASRCAETKWLIKPAGPFYQNIPKTEQAKRNWDWYINYWFGGDLLAALSADRYDVRPDPQPWWPREWLGRLCLICKHRWDEAVVDTAQAEGAA